jgi:hypothetical protein
VIPLPNLLIVIFYGSGALFGILFMIALSRTDWYRHPWGRNVMLLDILLTIAEVFAFSGVFLRKWPGRIWVGVVLVGAISVTQAWRWGIQVAGNRRQRVTEARQAEMIARGQRKGDPS